MLRLCDVKQMMRKVFVAVVYIIEVNNNVIGIHASLSCVLNMLCNEQWRSNEFESAGNCFCRAPPLFWLYKSFWWSLSWCQYSLVSFLFAVLLLKVPPCPAICKSWGSGCHTLWSRRHWSWTDSEFVVSRHVFCYILSISQFYTGLNNTDYKVH